MQRARERERKEERKGIDPGCFRKSRLFSSHDVSKTLSLFLSKKTHSATLEYKLVALDGAGNPADWQLGDNRIVEVARGGKVSSIAVEESWEGGEAAVEVTVAEEEARAAPAAAPKAPTAAAPVANAPAPSAVAAGAAAAAAAVPKAAAPAPKPWAAAAAPAAAASSSPSPSSSPSSSKALSSLTVPQLKAKLKSAGLSTTGKKAELIARLEKGA